MWRQICANLGPNLVSSIQRFPYHEGPDYTGSIVLYCFQIWVSCSNLLQSTVTGANQRKLVIKQGSIPQNSNWIHCSHGNLAN